MSLVGCVRVGFGVEVIIVWFVLCVALAFVVFGTKLLITCDVALALCLDQAVLRVCKGGRSLENVVVERWAAFAARVRRPIRGIV